MSKRDEFESILMGVYPVNNTKLYGALEAALEEAFDEGHDEGHEEAYDEGYDDGTEEADDLHDEDTIEGSKAAELQARYHYLKDGGEWQREGAEDPCCPLSASTYAAGFLDAMRTLGVKP